MTTINPVGNALSGVTGSGHFAGSTSPTFVTPTLGAATATSLTFGGGTLSTFTDLTTFMPTITFVTPGDLSVSYATQLGWYSQIGNILTFGVYVTFTPTYTTASGNFFIVPMNILCAANTNGIAPVYCPNAGFTFPVGTTSLIALVNGGANNDIAILGQGSATTTQLTTTNIVTGVAHTFSLNMTYIV